MGAMRVFTSVLMFIGMSFLCAPLAQGAEPDYIISLETGTMFESWSVWEGETFGGPEPAKSQVNDDWSENNAYTFYRFNYATAGAGISAGYGTSNGVFSKLGRAKRDRYAIELIGRGHGASGHGIILGARYYKTVFENPTTTLGDNEYFEMNIGYSYTMNPMKPGWNANLRILSCTPLYAGVGMLVINNTDTSQEISAIPLSAEIEMAAGYRARSFPLNIGVGYRFLYFNAWMTKDFKSGGVEERYIGNLVHGVFVKGEIGLGLFKP